MVCRAVRSQLINNKQTNNKKRHRLSYTQKQRRFFSAAQNLSDHLYALSTLDQYKSLFSVHKIGILVVPSPALGILSVSTPWSKFA